MGGCVCVFLPQKEQKETKVRCVIFFTARAQKCGECEGVWVRGMKRLV